MILISDKRNPWKEDISNLCPVRFQYHKQEMKRRNMDWNEYCSFIKNKEIEYQKLIDNMDDLEIPWI